jgi:S-adenosylmethionine:tRNA ribosyltransferase-isomerase
LERLTDYDYELPEELIAQEPLPGRSMARLLWLHRRTGRIEHRRFSDLCDILEPGDLLVVNETRVSALRLVGHKPSGGRAELLLLRRLEEGHYLALVKPGRRLRAGATVFLADGLIAELLDEPEPGIRRVRILGASDPELALHRIGRTPLPPYVKRPLDDDERYQTVYARSPGSAAAPTAGLHFTTDLLDALKAKGVIIATVTLDVGLDTFRPITAEDVSLHRMHGERCSAPEETRQAIEGCGGRIVAVGTTTVRTLESFATRRRRIRHGEATTELFIRPGLEFRIVDGMITNFHLPRTSMLVLVSAFAGRSRVMRAYGEAIRHRYRFLSFGDAMLIL